MHDPCARAGAVLPAQVLRMLVRTTCAHIILLDAVAVRTLRPASISHLCPVCDHVRQALGMYVPDILVASASSGRCHCINFPAI